MKQIDQDPGEYRAQPLKREPVFAPGGLKRLGAFGIVLLIGLAASILTYPVYLFSCNFITKTCIEREPITVPFNEYFGLNSKPLPAE